LMVNQTRCKALNIDPKFLDEEMVYIKENIVASVVTRQDGLQCKICKEFFPYSVANQEDGCLVCYSCRQNPYH